MNLSQSMVTIRRLRKDAPAWSWTAKRSGFGGYEYHGECAFGRVRVHAVAMLCGPTEDDYATEWRVEDGRASHTYFGWLQDQKVPF